MWVIDRFEGDVAVLENTETLEIHTHPRAELPGDAAEGDVLAVANGLFVPDRPETERRAARIRARFQRVKKM